MALPFQKAITGNSIKNNGAAVLNAGNTPADSPVTKSISQISNNNNPPLYGQNLTASVSPASSGNIGLAKAISGSKFAGFYDGKYVMQRYGFINGTANTALNSAAGDVKDKGFKGTYGYRRYNITSWNAVTGAATKGSAAGDLVLASGVDGTTGFNADDSVKYRTSAVPGELVVFTGKLNMPTQLDYNSKTNS